MTYFWFQNSPESWAIVFTLSGVVCIVGAAAFLFFATAEEQEWAKAPGTAHAWYGPKHVTSGDTSGAPDVIHRPDGEGEGWSNVDINVPASREGREGEMEKSHKFYEENFPELVTSGIY